MPVINENSRPTKKEEKLEIYLFHQQIVLTDYCVLSKTLGTGNTRINRPNVVSVLMKLKIYQE